MELVFFCVFAVQMIVIVYSVTKWGVALRQRNDALLVAKRLNSECDSFARTVYHLRFQLKYRDAPELEIDEPEMSVSELWDSYSLAIRKSKGG